MRRSFYAALASLIAAAVPAVIIACGDDSAPVGAGLPSGTPNEADGAAAGGNPSADAAPLPPIVNNTCKGVPVESGHHFVTSGMCANVVAAIPAVRQLTFAPNGDMFAVDNSGSIKRLHDADGDGFFQASEISTYADTGGNGNNCHIDVASGYLYAGGANGVRRWPWSPTATTGGAAEDVVTGQPGGGHAKRTVRVYDGYLYVGSGSAANIAMNTTTPDAYDDQRSLIRRFQLSAFTSGTPFAWASGEVVTVGLRNPNGFSRNAAGRMYGVVNGMDEVGYQGTNVHNDNPGEQVVEIAMGKQYGYPFCFTAQRVPSPANPGQVIAPGTQLQLQGGAHDDAWCLANASPPATFIQAHSAPLDIAFFDSHPKGGLPERFRGGAFVALHGSWDRSPATGYKVIWIPFDADGKAPTPTSTMTETTFPYETVFGGGTQAGAVDGPWSWTGAQGYSDQPRFAGVTVSPVDGALYVTSDTGGYVYRLGLPN